VSASDAQRPWYREVWPWLLMLPPLASVIGGVTMVYLAVGSPEALVVEDYARIEEITRERYTAEHRATELGVGAVVALRAVDGATQIVVEVEGGPAFSLPRELALHFRHAGREDADRAVALKREADRYVGATDLAVGRYELELAPLDDAWRLTGLATQATERLALGAAGQVGE
jgi:hypothetical protein